MRLGAKQPSLGPSFYSQHPPATQPVSLLLSPWLPNILSVNNSGKQERILERTRVVQARRRLANLTQRFTQTQKVKMYCHEKDLVRGH